METFEDLVDCEAFMAVLLGRIRRSTEPGYSDAVAQLLLGIIARSPFTLQPLVRNALTGAEIGSPHADVLRANGAAVLSRVPVPWSPLASFIGLDARVEFLERVVVSPALLEIVRATIREIGSDDRVASSMLEKLATKA